MMALPFFLAASGEVILSVEAIRIVRSFVAGLPKDPDDVSLVKAILAMAKGLDLKVVAEGVENASILAQLQTLGCDDAQGYHFAKPLAFDAFGAWVAKHAQSNAVAV